MKTIKTAVSSGQMKVMQEWCVKNKGLHRIDFIKMYEEWIFEDDELATLFALQFSEYVVK